MQKNGKNQIHQTNKRGALTAWITDQTAYFLNVLWRLISLGSSFISDDLVWREFFNKENFDDNCFWQLLRREIDAALLDRDRTIKEAHELREKLGIFIIVKMTVLKKNFNDDNYKNQTIEVAWKFMKSLIELFECWQWQCWRVYL